MNLLTLRGESAVPGIKSKREWVPLDRLVRDPGLQMRATLADGLTDPATVERYREAMAEGKEFPPLEAVSDGDTYWLFDGFQRAAAMELAGKGSVECLVVSGSYQDALLRSIAANARHGLTRTMNDCRRALTTLIDTPDLLQMVLAHAKDQGGVHIALATTCCISKGLVYKVLEERNLRVAGGKLVKKRTLPEQHIDVESSSERTDSPKPTLRSDISQSQSTQLPEGDQANANSPPNREADEFRELERARHAVASVWNACWKLLDGPFATHLLRCASLHRVPFTRKDASNPPVAGQAPNETSPAIAGWEPLGKIEAVLADLAASVSGGLDQAGSE
jgi:hypothetical protein